MRHLCHPDSPSRYPRAEERRILRVIGWKWRSLRNNLVLSERQLLAFPSLLSGPSGGRSGGESENQFSSRAQV